MLCLSSHQPTGHEGVRGANAPCVSVCLYLSVSVHVYLCLRVPCVTDLPLLSLCVFLIPLCFVVTAAAAYTASSAPRAIGESQSPAPSARYLCVCVCVCVCVAAFTDTNCSHPLPHTYTHTCSGVYNDIRKWLRFMPNRMVMLRDMSQFSMAQLITGSNAHTHTHMNIRTHAHTHTCFFSHLPFLLCLYV